MSICDGKPPSMAVLETERLVLRRMEPEDAGALAAVLSDPVAMQYYPHAFSREEVAQWIERWMASYDANGYGLYAMVLRKTGRIIGDCGHALQDVDGKREIEIGYHVRRDLWGQGYATEAARACVAYGFETLCAPRLISLIRPQNLPSRRVAEKMGMTVASETVRKGILHLVYAISPPA